MGKLLIGAVVLAAGAAVWMAMTTGTIERLRERFRSHAPRDEAYDRLDEDLERFTARAVPPRPAPPSPRAHRRPNRDVRGQTIGQRASGPRISNCHARLSASICSTSARCCSKGSSVGLPILGLINSSFGWPGHRHTPVLR